jgi:hypothetical protein
MFTEALRNFIHREILRVFDRRTRRVPCLVDSYNPSQHTVKVKLQPEGTLTGWLQIQTDQVGWQIAPNIGDPGWVEFHEADRRAGVFVGSNHNDLNPPPAQIQTGEWHYQNKFGAWLYFKNDGSITWQDSKGDVGKFDGAGNISLTALTSLKIVIGGITFEISSSGVAITGGAVTHNGHDIGSDHLHTDVQSGPDLSGPPQ